MASLFGGWVDIKWDAGLPVVLNVKPILFRKTNSESRPQNFRIKTITLVSNINILLKTNVIKEKGRKVEMEAQNKKREEKGRVESERGN